MAPTQRRIGLRATKQAALERLVPVYGANNHTVCLAGNPNTGKSTVFNGLTGLSQHTGNWPGKTVAQARGLFRYRDKIFNLVDLPGAYSLFANSPEEEITRDFLCWQRPDAVVVVVDASCLQRNLNFVLQVLEITPKVIMCLNLIDEAERKGLLIDVKQLATDLGIPVVPTAANTGRGLSCLKAQIHAVASGRRVCQPLSVKYPSAVERAVAELEGELAGLPMSGLNRRWVALRLLENATLAGWLRANALN